MKMRMAFLASAIGALASAWGAVGDPVVWSNLDSDKFVHKFTKYTGDCSITLSEKEECPQYSVVAVSTITIGTHHSYNWRNPLTINGVTAPAPQLTEIEERTSSIRSDIKIDRLATFTFETPVRLVVGVGYPLEISAIVMTGIDGESVIDLPGLASPWTGYNTFCEVTGEVVSMPEEGPRTFTYTAGGWDAEIPEDYNPSDSIVIAADGATIDFRVLGPLTIDQGVTLTLAPGAKVYQTATTNNGTIRVSGGTAQAPVEIYEDGAVNSSIGEVVIGEDSVLRSNARGSGNRTYTVTGESTTTSRLILASDHNWGMPATARIRNCTVQIDHAFWLEYNEQLDATVDLVLNANVVTGHSGESKDYVFGSVSGTGSFNPTAYGEHTMTFNLHGDTTWSGTAGRTPVTLAGTGTLTYGGASGTICLPGLSGPGLTLSNDNFAGTVEIAEIDVGGTLTALNFAALGKANSTIVLKGVTGGANKPYLPNGHTVAATVRVDGPVTFSNGGWNQTYTFAKITGTGDLNLLDWGARDKTQYGYVLTKVEGYTGTLTASRRTVITELALAEEPAEGAKLLSLGADTDVDNFVLNGVTVAGEPAAFAYEVREDGVYRVGSDTPVYPDFIGDDPAKQAKYDAWKVGKEEAIAAADAELLEAGYLLNCLPTAAAVDTASGTFYLEIEVVEGVARAFCPNEENFNGDVVVTRYADVGCTTPDETGRFFRGELQ